MEIDRKERKAARECRGKTKCGDKCKNKHTNDHGFCRLHAQQSKKRSPPGSEDAPKKSIQKKSVSKKAVPKKDTYTYTDYLKEKNGGRRSAPDTGGRVKSMFAAKHHYCGNFEACVTVDSEDSFGSGICVSSDKDSFYILTAAHAAGDVGDVRQVGFAGLSMFNTFEEKANQGDRLYELEGIVSHNKALLDYAKWRVQKGVPVKPSDTQFAKAKLSPFNISEGNSNPPLKTVQQQFKQDKAELDKIKADMVVTSSDVPKIQGTCVQVSDHYDLALVKLPQSEVAKHYPTDDEDETAFHWPPIVEDLNEEVTSDEIDEVMCVGQIGGVESRGKSCLEISEGKCLSYSKNPLKPQMESAGLAHNCPVYAGNSGGPILNGHSGWGGQLVGIHTGFNHNKFHGEAVTLEAIKKFLGECPEIQEEIE